MSAIKIRWGDTLDEDDSLPSNSIVGPDKSGVVTKTTYSRNDKGDIVKSVVKTRVSRVEKKIYAVRLAQAALPGCMSACHYIYTNLCKAYIHTGIAGPAQCCMHKLLHIGAVACADCCMHTRRTQQQGSSGSSASALL